MKSSFSVIIPCYNSEKFILGNIKKIRKKLLNQKIFFEIILVNDGSTDNTLSEINKLKSNFIKIINLKKNRGKSYAVRQGLKKAKNDFIILIDCDLPYFAKFTYILKKLEEGFDFVSVNRRHKDSKIINRHLNLYQKFRLYVGSLIGYIIYFVLIPKIKTKDTQAGLKGLRNSTKLKKKNFLSNKFFLDVELFSFFSKKKTYLVPVKYIMDVNSTIKIFSTNSFKIIYEILIVLIFLRIF